MKNTVSKKDMLAQILAHTTDEAEINFLQHEIDLLTARNARRSGQLSDTQKENLQTMTEIVAWMGATPNQSATIADIRKHFGLTAQKVVPMMNKLYEQNKVCYTVEKKVKVYKLIQD